MNENLREEAKPNEEFRKQRRRKFNATESEGMHSKRNNNSSSMWNTREMPQLLTPPDNPDGLRGQRRRPKQWKR
jgi:hypothetical protein